MHHGTWYYVETGDTIMFRPHLTAPQCWVWMGAYAALKPGCIFQHWWCPLTDAPPTGGCSAHGFQTDSHTSIRLNTEQRRGFCVMFTTSSLCDRALTFGFWMGHWTAIVGRIPESCVLQPEKHYSEIVKRQLSKILISNHVTDLLPVNLISSRS